MHQKEYKGSFIRHIIRGMITSLLVIIIPLSIVACDKGSPLNHPVPGGGCQTGTIACNGSCVNTQTDNNNCGACGNVCSTGSTCSSGQCVAQCIAPFTLCNGTCVNAQTDSNNCGSCGIVCPSGSTCSGGVCLG
ncbi:Stigma-specific protein, Stig1 [Legionella steigerwaltii]|uniref:Stigma-specific protein, Stig1 n=1 Tax=Legionella steigerwaltii TaxID=460 RepID=A0A378L9U9_9GAMM|nr:Stigma-specific protein, Stig1 [Legionella steigerwaltii]STY22489.1 Stigma-specific protein, Stig1 [Legionella steigerwaltii]